MIKFYDVEKDYIKYLQTLDAQVPNIEYSTNNKFVCGIVLSINNINYYAPISHMKIKQQTNMLIFNNGLPISTIRFSFMIPAYDEVLIEKNFKQISLIDQQYADLLNAEYLFCKKNESQIIDKANSVYKIGCNKHHRLNYTCCDFKLLEQKYMKYKK